MRIPPPLSLALAAVVLAAQAPAHADPASDAMSTLRERLAAGFETPPSRADLAAASGLTDDELDGALAGLYRDPSSLMIVRMRVLDLMDGHPSPELRALLDESLAAKPEASALERRLVDAAVRTYGTSDPELCERAMSRALESSDVLVRYHASRALAELPPETAARLAGTALERETDPDVRAEMRRVADPTAAQAATTGRGEP